MSTLYDTDFYSWTLQQAALLQMGEVMALDRINLIAELEDMGISQRRALEHRLQVLLLHLLKWCYQPSCRSKSWQGTIMEQRNRIKRVLRQNPGLRQYMESISVDAYEDARPAAMGETDLELDTFPPVCPWNVTQVMDDDFWPE